MIIKRNMDTIGLIAPKQWGKTTFIKQITKGMDKSKIFVLDTNYEYLDFPNRVKPRDYTSKTLDDFIKHCRRHTNILVIVDDIDVYVNRFPSEEFKKLMINGSHQNIGFIYTSKRPKEIPKLLLAETVHLLCGRMIIDDIIYLKGLYSRFETVCDNCNGIGESVSPEGVPEHCSACKGSGVTYILNNIPRYSFLYRNKDTQQEKIFTTSINK